MFEWLVDPEAWISLLTLAALDIVLGIDNIIFFSKQALIVNAVKYYNS